MPHETGLQHDDNQDFPALLRKAELFSGLLEDDLAFIATRVDTIPVESGESIFTSGEKARRFFIVKSGQILVFRAMAGGRVDEMARYVPGDVLADP